jgi:hypothetical protein
MHRGIPVAIDEQGGTLSDVADMRGSAPAIAAAIVAGTLTGGMGAVPAMAAVGGSAAGAKGIDEMLDLVSGDNLQTAGEVGKDIVTEGGLAMAGEGVFRAVLAPIGRKLLAPEGKRMTDETRELMRQTESIGARANVSQITKAPLLGRAQAMMNRIFGDRLEAQNSQALLDEAVRLKVSVGPAVQAREVGEVVSTGIRNARQKFALEANEKYGRVDAIVGGKPVIPTVSLKQEAFDILNEVPTLSSGKPGLMASETRNFLSEIDQLPDFVTSKQMQAVRARLFDSVYTGDLVPGLSSRHSRLLFDAAGKGFDDAGRILNPAVQATKQEINQAVSLLKDATKFYKEGIRKFDDQLIARITRDIGKPGALDHDLIVHAIFKKGNPSRIAKVRRLVPEKDWNIVRRKAMEDILKKMSQRTEDPRVDVFNGKGFLNALDDFGDEALTEMFGKETTRQLRTFGSVMQFVTQRQAQSGGLVAAHIALHPLKNIGRLTWMNFMSRFLNSKAGMQWLTEGIKAPNTREGMSALIRATTLTSVLAEQGTGVADLVLTEPEEPPLQ